MLRLPFRIPQVKRLLAVVLSLLLVGALPLLKIAFGGDLRLSLGNPFQPAPPPRAELVNVPRHGDAEPLKFDTLTGRSGRVRVMLLTVEEMDLAFSFVKRLGPQALKPGIKTVTNPKDGGEFSFITLTPWREKRGTFVHTYHVGWWPGERSLMPSNYRNPVGFVEVTPDVTELRVSSHFTLGDFITHDQERIWPKYVVLREELLDKLELVLQTLEAQGTSASHAVVLSGFRTPQYNQRAAFEGAAYASRHQFGDAADLIIDSNGDGRMDDLNHDGTADFRDTDVINRAVERVERQYPELVGGLGLYHATGPRGPFAHIDVRGTRARWTNSVSAGKVSKNLAASSDNAASSPLVGRCKAEGASAALCAGTR